jgi:DNA-directed RNA polymerase subunit RPC12/RpoP
MIGIKIAANGGKHITRFCLDCNKTFGSSPAHFPGWEELPVVADYRTEEHPCEVCGSTETELHHYAPRHIFGIISERYARGYLCKTCHDNWHKEMAKHDTNECKYCRGSKNR